jgi:integrase
VPASRRAVYGAGSCEQVAPDRWRLRWSEGVDPFTGKHQRRTETISAKSAKDARRELASRTSARRTLSRVTFGDLLDLALPQLPISERTRENYGFVLKHIPPAARAWVAAEMTVINGRTIIEGLTAKCGPQTVKKIHTALMACWRQATLNGWVDTNPWHRQRLPKLPVSAGRTLEPEQVKRLLDCCVPGIERVWIDIHLATGARPGEVVALRWSNIDLDDRVIVMTDAKHGGVERRVAILESTAARIRGWQQAQRERAVAAHGVQLDADPFLLSNDSASGVPWREAYAGSFRWPRLRDLAKLPAGVRLYDLRHVHNSYMDRAGIDATTRAARIGNSPATNQRVYSHPMRDRDAAEVMAELLG